MASYKLHCLVKYLNEQQRKCMIWDIERGQSNQIEPLPWQTDTCIGGWHYDRRIYDNKGYKSAKTVIHTLADIVSKNGNLLLNIPVRGDGTIDSEERTVVEGIGAWMQVNSEAFIAPLEGIWRRPGDKSAAPISAQGFNEGKGKPLGPTDMRFVIKGDVLYATVFGWPDTKKVVIKSLAKDSANYPKEITKVELLASHQSLSFERTPEGLIVTMPDTVQPCPTPMY